MVLYIVSLADPKTHKGSGQMVCFCLVSILIHIFAGISLELDTAN